MIFRFDRVRKEEVNVVCVHVQMCVQFVHADTQMCLKHFLIKRRWQIIMIQRWLWSSLASFHSQLTTITFTFYQEQTQQRCSNINTMKKVIGISLIIQRQKPRDLNKGMVFTRFMKGHCIRRWGGGDTDVYLRDPCAFLWGKLGGTEGLLCCIGPCRHSQNKYCETLHNATRDS